MIKIALVAGDFIDKTDKLISDKGVEVRLAYRTVSEFWDDVMERGSTAFVDIDKIIVLYPGFLNEEESSYEEQVLNTQGFMNVSGLRTPLYIITKSSDLYDTISKDRETYVTYDKFALMAFKGSIGPKIITEVIKGERDSYGLKHENFFIPDEEEEEIEEEPEGDKEEKEEEEKFEGYADTKDKNKEVEKKQREKRKKEDKKKGKKFFNFGGSKGDSKKSESNEKVEKTKPKEKPKKEKKPKESSKGRNRVELVSGVFAVTGDRQSGVSTTVANMADTYAKHGKTVLIVDLDIRRRFLSKFYGKFEEEVERDTRVSHGLLAGLVNPRNVEDVHAIVNDNVGLLAVDDTVDSRINRFANKDFKDIWNSTSLINLFSYAKSIFDVVIIDFPLEIMKEVGDSLSYVDKVVMCVPNTGFHLDQLLEYEMDDLLYEKEIIGHSLLSKSHLLMTQYKSSSKLSGKEMTPRFVEDLLISLDEPRFHLEVIGKVDYTDEFVDQFSKGRTLVDLNKEYRNQFEDILQELS